jgi:hypothetical protein
MAEPERSSTEMSMTPENTVRGWRDLADQLTPEQVDLLLERESAPDEHAALAGSPERTFDRDKLLAGARHYARDNLAVAMIDNIPEPAGAVEVTEWADPDSPGAFRLFYGATRTVELDDGADINVTVLGTQATDGSVDEHGILIDGGSDDTITTHEGRRLAAALVEAADEVDRLAAGDE